MPNSSNQDPKEKSQEKKDQLKENKLKRTPMEELFKGRHTNTTKEHLGKIGIMFSMAPIKRKSSTK